MACECCSELRAELQRIRQDIAGLDSRFMAISERNDFIPISAKPLIDQAIAAAKQRAEDAKQLAESAKSLAETAKSVADSAIELVNQLERAISEILASISSILRQISELFGITARIDAVANKAWELANRILDIIQGFASLSALNQLKIRVSALENVVDTIISTVTSFRQKIERNSSRIGVVESGLETVRNLARNALSKASEAFNLAGTAKSTADRAQNSADNAQSTADTALARADSARQLASDALSKAIAASREANAAYLRAGTAIQRADNAQSTANTALARADSARQLASNAVSQAISASREANAAYQRAGEAVRRATENTRLLDLMEAILNKISEQNTKILLRVGAETDFPISLPASLTDEGNSQTEVETIPQFMAYFIRQLDAITGQYPIKIELKDTDPLASGNQSETISLPNQSEAMAEMFGLAYEANTNSELAINILFRLIPEIIAAKNSSLTGQDYSQAIANWLGFRTRNVERSIDSNFNPLQANSLPDFLQNSEYKIQGVEDDDPHTLIEWVQQLKYAASLMKASVFRGADLGDLFGNEVENIATESGAGSEEVSETWEAFIDALNRQNSNLTDTDLHPRPRATSVNDVLNPETVLPDRPDN